MKPTVQEVKDALWSIYLDLPDEDEGIEVRLQYIPGEGWEVHSGPPDYDLNHKGFWGSGWIEGSCMEYLEEVAQDLLAQVEDMEAETHA
jgi:hypothetical protein